jgi:hypothetical protein
MQDVANTAAEDTMLISCNYKYNIYFRKHLLFRSKTPHPIHFAKHCKKKIHAILLNSFEI